MFFGAEVVQASLIASVTEQFFPILMKTLPHALAQYKTQRQIELKLFKWTFQFICVDSFFVSPVSLFIFLIKWNGNV